MWKKIIIKGSKFNIILDYNMTYDNICQRNVATKTIYDTKVTNNWKILRRMFGPTKGRYDTVHEELKQMIN